MGVKSVKTPLLLNSIGADENKRVLTDSGGSFVPHLIRAGPLYILITPARN